MFSAYLWGIETRYTRRPGRKSSSRFSAYLWGIETHPGSGRTHRKGGFQPTYEELKPVIIRIPGVLDDRFSAYLWGIETACPPWSDCPRPRFQPTYEELKPFRSRWSGAGRVTVFSLPMRNWNPFMTVTFGVLSRAVFSLPMRNWNLVPPAQGATRISFSAYLWGIETRLRGVCGGPRWRRFSAYLWGIET